MRKLVVAGLLVGDDGRVLISQRRADQALPLQWEFQAARSNPARRRSRRSCASCARSLASRSRSGASGTCSFTGTPTSIS